jgi:hypothetical protein
MSTRCTVHFTSGAGGAHSDAIIYRHSDGYPESMLPDLADFFDAVMAQTTDHRFGDPSYLAAKYVVWLADQFAKKLVAVGDSYEYVKAEKLDFISVGVVQADPDDIEYRYTVHCRAPREGDCPDVTVEEV